MASNICSCPLVPVSVSQVAGMLESGRNNSRNSCIFRGSGRSRTLNYGVVPFAAAMTRNAAVASGSNASGAVLNYGGVVPFATMKAAVASEHQVYEREELNEDIESFGYLVNTVQCMLHFKYRTSTELDESDTRLLLEEVLRFHPRASEKIGCGLSSLLVDFHPDYKRSRCFMIKRTDDSTCDFSYRKCMLERARMKGIEAFMARKLLNMDYMDIAKSASMV